MCELFAMSNRYPADISFSLECFARHGGLTAPHKDGWGIAFHGGHDTQLFREPAPAANSPTVHFIRNNAFASKIALSQIRVATRGGMSLIISTKHRLRSEPRRRNSGSTEAPQAPKKS